jgi:hypothetical protein
MLGISPEATGFDTRGFRGGGGGMRNRIESIGSIFTQGYSAALEEGDLKSLSSRLEQVDLEFRGFAYEGAAMALALLDRLTPFGGIRLRDFLEGSGAPHTYMVHVAVGWAAARLPGKLERAMKPLDPLLRWLVVDGFGFHEGFFRWPKYIEGQSPPRRVSGYACRVFDQGFGRSLWFIEGGDPERLRHTIDSFAPARRGDLWSGAGLAITYAGQATPAGLQYLRAAAGSCQPQLAQGSAFAAKARVRAGNVVPYTQEACAVLCGLAPEAAAQVTDDALENLPTNQAEPAYELWRRRIQQHFTQHQESKR